MPFAPSDISGLKIWLKADAGAGSSDGDPVGTWTDQSGTSHDFTQATSGKKPLYKVNIKNSLPAVRFDGSDDEMSAGDLSAVFPSAGTIACAVKATSGSYMVYKTKENDSWWQFGGSGYWGAFRSSRLASTGTMPNDSAWHIFSCTAVASAYKVWVDAVNKINSGSFTFDGGNDHNLAHQTTFGHYTAMDLGELIVYDSVLSDADRQQVEQYLSTRWAIAFPDGYANPTTVQAVGTVPAPTVTSDTGNPATVAGAGAVPAPAVTGTAVASPATVAGTGTVPAPTATGVNTATPARVAGVGTVPAPTVFSLQNGLAMPATVRGVVHIYRPTFPSTVSSGGGSGGSGGGGTSEISSWWTVYLGPSDGGGA
jgi:hypothetical protein